MFHFASPTYSAKHDVILSELMSAITNKLRFVFFPSTYVVLSGPETLLAAYSWARKPASLKMLPEILNKRLQTLDLKSIMSELQRSSSEIKITLKDTLSSVHRFKRKEGSSLSQ